VFARKQESSRSWLEVKDGIAVRHEDLDIWVDVILKGGVSVGTKTWFVGFSYDVFRVVAG